MHEIWTRLGGDDPSDDEMEWNNAVTYLQISANGRLVDTIAHRRLGFQLFRSEEKIWRGALSREALETRRTC